MRGICFAFIGHLLSVFTIISYDQQKENTVRIHHVRTVLSIGLGNHFDHFLRPDYTKPDAVIEAPRGDKKVSKIKASNI